MELENEKIESKNFIELIIDKDLEEDLTMCRLDFHQSLTVIFI